MSAHHWPELTIAPTGRRLAARFVAVQGSCKGTYLQSERVHCPASNGVPTEGAIDRMVGS
jgi:hypothetical protein